jgi:outer membrane protein assembly factor BamD (BamD/ComL family)
MVRKRKQFFRPGADFTILFGFLLLMISWQPSWGQSGREKEKKDYQAIPEVVMQQQLNLARQHYRDGAFDKAIAILDKYYWEQPSHLNYTYYFYSLMATQQFENAADVVKYQMRKYKNELRYEVDLGYVYQSMNESRKATRIFDRLLKNLENHPNQIRSVANTFKSHRENDYALKTYLLGRKIEQNPRAYGLEVARLYETMGKFQPMVKEYLAILMDDARNLSQVKYRLQHALGDDPEGQKYTFLKQTLLEKVQESPDEKRYADLLLWLALQHQDFGLALRYGKALDKRFGLQGREVFDIGNIALNNKSYQEAIEAFDYSRKKLPRSNPLFFRAHIDYLEARFAFLTSQAKPSFEKLKHLENDYLETLSTLGHNQNTFSLAEKLAEIQAFYLHKTDDAKKILEKNLTIPGVNAKEQARSKILLADILLFGNDYWEATLLYSQVEKAFKNEPLGHEAKMKNAMLSYYIGEFGWAKGKFDILRAATSKLIANDAMEMSFFLEENLSKHDSLHTAMKLFAKADLLFYQHRFKEAVRLLDSLSATHPSHPLTDDIRFKKAEIFEQTRNYQKADSLYEFIYKTYPYGLLADNAIMASARLNTSIFKNTGKAMQLYRTILKDYPGSLYVMEARKKYRYLRGDSGDE